MQHYKINVNLNWKYVLLSFTTSFGKLLFSYPIANCIDPGGFVTFQTISNLLHFFVSTTLSDNIWFNFHLTRETDFTTLHCSALHCTSMCFNCILLYSTACTILNFTPLYYNAIHFTSLHCTALLCTVIRYTALHCTALHCTALHCTALYCTALHCTALQCTALHCTALHCTALHCTAPHRGMGPRPSNGSRCCQRENFHQRDVNFTSQNYTLCIAPIEQTNLDPGI